MTISKIRLAVGEIAENEITTRELPFTIGWTPERCLKCGGNLLLTETNGHKHYNCLQCSSDWELNGDSMRRRVVVDEVYGNKIK